MAKPKPKNPTSNEKMTGDPYLFRVPSILSLGAPETEYNMFFKGFDKVLDKYKDIDTDAETIKGVNNLKAHMELKPSPEEEPLYYFSPVTPEDAEKATQTYVGLVDNTATGLITALIAAEAASLGQLDMTLTEVMRHPIVEAALSIASKVHTATFMEGIYPAYRYKVLKDYQPLRAEAQVIVENFVKGIIDFDTFLDQIEYLGYDTDEATKLANSAYRYLDAQTLLQLNRRGIISDGDFQLWLRRIGLHPDQTSKYEELKWQLPGYADIISVYMREGYLPEKWVEIPDEFITYMGQLGYSSDWAARLWGKHWVLPGVDLLYDMFHKKIIDYDTMAKMLKYHDFEPVWRDRLIANAYNMIPRVDLRRAYRYNMLSAEQLQERYEWLGFKTEDAQIMSGVALRSSLDRYYTRLETVARAAFRKGKLSEGAFKSILKIINTPEEAIPIIFAAERLATAVDVREVTEEPRTLTASQILSLYKQEILSHDQALSRLEAMEFSVEDAGLLLSLYAPVPPAPPPKTVEDRRAELLRGPRILSPSEVLKAYSTGLINREDASTKLLGMGYTAEDVSFLLSLSEPRPEPMEVNRELISAAATLYREGFMTQPIFEGYLRKAGLSESDISRKVDAEELRYRYDYLKDLVALAKTAYEKDVYTREELEGYLLYYGMQLDRVQAISSLEELKKLPKPKAAG